MHLLINEIQGWPLGKCRQQNVRFFLHKTLSPRYDFILNYHFFTIVELDISSFISWRVLSRSSYLSGFAIWRKKGKILSVYLKLYFPEDFAIFPYFIFWRRPFSVVLTPFLLFCVMNFANKHKIAVGQKQIETSIKFSFVLCARANK